MTRRRRCAPGSGTPHESEDRTRIYGAAHRLDVQLQPSRNLLLLYPFHQMQVADLGPLTHPDHLRVLLAESTRRSCLVPSIHRHRTAISSVLRGPCTFPDDAAGWSRGVGQATGSTEGSQLMHPLILQHQITPKTSRYTRCSMSMLPNVSINGRIRSSGQLGRWWYSISPCRNSECVRRFTVFAFNQRS